MAEIKTKIRIFTIADFIEEENWLVEQHSKGWKLVKMIPPCFFDFEKSSPEDIVYKLDYRNRPVKADYIQIYQDYSWEYVGSCVGWNYFRKSDVEVANENELDIFQMISQD